MTIAISLKVNDGLVLASDSASTVIEQDASGSSRVRNVYNNADKIFNLLKGSPIGLITWGLGAIGAASTTTLSKDLRSRLAGKDSNNKDWAIDPADYKVSSVAEKVRDFMFTENYEKVFAGWKEPPSLGFIVAGYSVGERLAEEYQIDIQNGKCKGPYQLRNLSETGLTANGQPEAVARLLLGYGTAMPQILVDDLKVSKDQLSSVMNLLHQRMSVQLVEAAMPIQDAIDLAEFLVDLTINFSRFSPGASTVGGPIEVAAISKHEGFKWIRRKHYFKRDLNPDDLQQINARP